jgi:tetratricopeptide (TPR) repeat protein
VNLVPAAESWLQEGVAAAKAGQPDRARTLLLRAVEVEERNVQAWYWLSRVVEAPEEREICLENVLALDPGHTAVQAELAELRRKRAEADRARVLSREAVAAAIPRTAEEWLISEATIEPLGCPYCGRPTAADERQCPGCGHELYVLRPKSKKHSVYSWGLIAGWVMLANLIWLGLFGYYLFSSLSAALAASAGAQRTSQALIALLGLEQPGGYGSPAPLLPVLLGGGLVFGLSLVVAWRLTRRSRFFYWLTVALILLFPLSVIYRVLFFIALACAFMAYDEFAWIEERLDAGVDRDVESHSALYARGRHYAEQGMWAKAEAHWARAVALAPGHPDYRLALASAYLSLDQPGRALEHLDSARQIEPDHPQLQDLLQRAQEAGIK